MSITDSKSIDPVRIPIMSELITNNLLMLMPEENNELARMLLLPGWVFSMIYLASVVLDVDLMPYGKLRQRKDGYYGFPPWLGWMIQESPSFFIPITALLSHIGKADVSLFRLVTLAAMATHYFNRTFVYSMKIKSEKKVPVLMCVSAFIFCFYNGFMQSHAILHNDPTHGKQFIAGLATFAVGMLINVHSDQLLINLRQKNEKGYKVPQGGLFPWLSSPNYSGEILEWWGFALMAGTQAAIWFAVWSTLYLGHRAFRTHKFYKEKFKEDYPQTRRAVIPFVL